MLFSGKKIGLTAALLSALATAPELAAKTTVLRNYDFNKGTFGWVTPGYWTGKTVRNAANGSMILTPGSRNGSPLSGRCYTQSGLEDVRGLNLELSCRVRGSGKARIGAYYAVLNGKASKWHYSPTVELTSDYQTIRFPMDFSQLGVSTIWPIIEMTSAGQVEFDDMVISMITAENAPEIKGQSVIYRHVDGEAFPAVDFQTAEPDAEYAVFAGSGDTPEAPVMLKSDAQGKLTVPGELIKRRRDNQALVTVARNGVNFRTRIELMLPELHQQLDKTASQIKLSKNLSIAVLADSLWDFDRGWNTASELEFWLNKYNPNMVRIHNFAVRGNSIVTDELRFYQQITAYNWSGNKAMFNLQLNPDMVLIQLGHNDTRSFSGENFAKPWVSTAEQSAAFRRMICNLRRMWPASRIILITPVANDTDYMAKKSANEVRRKQPSWRFGDPDKVQAYIAELKNIAQEFDLELCDVYTPMQQITDRIKFFRPDGVHLVRNGYWHLTGLLLDYLAKHPNAPAVKALSAVEPFRGKFVLKDMVLPPAGATSPGLLKSSSGQRLLLGFGKLSKLPDGAMRMDGRTSGFGLHDSVTFNANNGVTLSMTCRNNALVHPQHKALFGAYFFKTNQFLFCRHNRNLYFNCNVGGRWIDGLSTSEVFDEEFGKESYHHIAATIKKHKVPSQGEDWLEVKLYLDGELVGQKRFAGVDLPASRFPLEIGSASYLGSVWRAKADVAEVEILDKVLNESEIEELFARQKLVKKKLSGVLTPDAEKLLQNFPAAPAQRSALRNLALSGVELSELKKVTAQPEKYFITIPGKESALTIFAQPDKVRIVSWYDQVKNRELLSCDAPFFSVNAIDGSRNITLSPLSGQVKNNFTLRPEKSGGSWKFTIQSDLGKNAFATTNYTITGDRMEYQVTVDTQKSKLRVKEVKQPDLRLVPLNGTQDTLLAPIMSGVLYPNAAGNGASYNDVYPHGTASMQLGAYYDKAGGIYWTLLDPSAAYKMLKYEAGRKRASVGVTFPVPGPANAPDKLYTTTGAAVLELFRGNWYDVGLCYRRDLERMNALWYRKTLPNTDTPQWMRNNLFSLRRLSNAQGDVPIMRQLRDYMECSFYISWGHPTSSNLYSPLQRIDPDSAAWVRDIHKLGLKTIPYTDPRLWQQHDRRSEDTLFSSLAKKHCAVEDGKVLIERYGRELCGVVCPVSEVIQQYMHKMLINMTNVGFDGIYADQIGAARPNLCESSQHGHTVRDARAHYRDGWRKLFMNVRSEWQRNGLENIISTEDNAEHCVGMMDAMLPWRWMYENQVPLYCMVYAGRTQFTGREPDCEEPQAIYPKAAVQIVNGEQLGFLEYPLITSPLRSEYRIFFKEIIHLRRAMLNFFNCGMMARPAEFAQMWGKKNMVWGVRGTGSVTTEDVVSSVWQYNGVTAFILINHTDKPRQNELLYQLPDATNQVVIYSSKTPEVLKQQSSQNLRLPIQMPPRSCMMILCAAANKDIAKLVQNTDAVFDVIRKAAATPDPFALDISKMRNTDAGKATDLHHARNAAEVSGARLNVAGNQINWIRDAVVSVGTVDFGDGSGSVLAASFAAPPRCGLGVAEFYVDDLQTANKIAEFTFNGKDFSTPNWNTFAFREAPLLQQITGKHQVFIKLQGSSFCNLRSWQIK